MRRNGLSRSVVWPVLLLTIILTYGLCSSFAFAASTGNKPETPKVAIGIPVPTPSFFPVYLADLKGFFKQEGLDAKVLTFAGDADVIQGLAGGSLQINVASLTGLVNAINAGQKFKSVWGGYNMAYINWHAQPKYKSIADTKGGRYAITKYGSLTDFLTRYLVRNAGLDPEKDVNILQIGTGPAIFSALLAGQVDVAVISPVQSYTAEEKGFPIIGSQKQIAPDWPTHIVYAKEDFIAKNPNTIKAFLRATSKTMDWMRANRDEAAELGNKILKDTVPHCRRAIDEMIDAWYPDGRMPQKGMKIFWDITVQSGDAKEAWADSKWLDPAFMKTQAQWRK